MARDDYQDDDGYWSPPEDYYDPTPPQFDPGPQGPGWLDDVIAGYAPQPQDVQAPGFTPTTNAPQPSGGGSGGSGGGGGGFSWPQFHAPALPNIAPLVAPPPFSFAEWQEPAPFSFESYRAPDPFTHPEFKQPTMEDAANEPGYQFGLEQGMGALKASLASRGVYRTGAAPKEFFTWANRAAEQNYGNVYNRAANTYGINRGNAFENFGANERNRAESYDRNRGNAFDNFSLNRNNARDAWGANRTNAADAYATNWGVTKDTFGGNLDRSFGLYDREFQGKQAEFNPNFQAATMQFDDLYRRWKSELDATTSIATSGAGL